jgi:CheY-like chemotaxis protein
MEVSTIDILLVEDDYADVVLTKKAMESSKVVNSMDVVGNGLEALQFLGQEGKFADASLPDLILLDLNMPRMDGREFLQEVKNHPDWKRIPVVVLTTSDADRDILKSYHLQASCYITKPVSLDQFREVVKSIQGFWLAVVKYPQKNQSNK